MNLKTNKIILYLLGVGSLGSGSALAWEYGVGNMVAGYFQGDSGQIELAVEEKKGGRAIDTLAWEEINPPTKQVDSLVEEDEEEDLRSSEMQKEVSGGYPRTTDKKPPGVRTGCICMDNDRQTTKGTGACAGHGGVRFWLYQQTNGLVLEHPTKRHKEHPSALASTELENLTYYNQKKYEYDGKNNRSTDSFFYMILGIFICITIAYIAKLWWTEDTKE